LYKIARDYKNWNQYFLLDEKNNKIDIVTANTNERAADKFAEKHNINKLDIWIYENVTKKKSNVPGLSYYNVKVGSWKYFYIKHNKSLLQVHNCGPVKRITDCVKIADEVFSKINWDVGVEEITENKSAYNNNLQEFKDKIKCMIE